MNSSVFIFSLVGLVLTLSFVVFGVSYLISSKRIASPISFSKSFNNSSSSSLSKTSVENNSSVAFFLSSSGSSAFGISSGKNISGNVLISCPDLINDIL